MTVYGSVLKTGNHVYCCTGKGIYKVKLRNGRPVSKKRIVKGGYSKGFPRDMKKKGRYLYYIAGSDAPGIGGLYRVKLSSGKKQRLDRNCPENYVISGSKLYFDYYYEDSDRKVTKVMKLNGKSKKVTKVSIHMKSKDSNKKKYRIVYKGDDETTSEYLKTPKGSLFLCKGEGD